MEHIKSQDSLTHAGQSIQLDQLKHELGDTVYQSNQSIVTSHKRAREDESGYVGHKDDTKKPSWHAAREIPPPPPSTTTSTTSSLHTQLRSSLLPDPESNQETHPSYTSPKSSADGDDVPRLPSIKQMRLDSPLESPRSHWGDYYSHHTSTTTPSYQTTQTPPPSTHPTNPSYSPAAYARSPLNVTQTINPPPAPPPPPAAYTTELVPIKTNNFGFIETTFTTAPVKKTHKRRPANIDKGSLFCHTCGSKNTPEWRRGPQGPATLCNACGLAYAKRLRQDEEAAASSASRAEQQQQQQQQQLTYDYSQGNTQPYYSLSYLTSPASGQLGDPYQLVPPQMATQSPYQSPQIASYIPYEQLAEYAALSGYNLYSPSRNIPTHSMPTHSISSHSIPSHSHSIPITPPASPMASPISTLSPASQIPRGSFRNGVVRSNGHTFHQYTPPVTSRTSSYINFSPNYSPTVTTTTTTTLMPLNTSPSSSNTSYLPEPTTPPPSSTNTPLLPAPESPVVYTTTAPTPTIISSIQPSPTRTTQPLQSVSSPPANPSLHSVQPATETMKTDQSQQQIQLSQQSTSSARMSPSLTPLSTIATLRPGTSHR